MDSLDILKQQWKRDGNFPKINKDEIRLMLHKSSSSIVKWIFMISVIELAVGIILFSIIPGDNKADVSVLTKGIDIAFNVLFYITILYFIYKFYTSYKNIQNTTNTKTLLHRILITRKHVENYIKFNIYCILFVIVVMTGIQIIDHYRQDESVSRFIIYLLFLSIFMVILTWVLLKLAKFYYKVLYRRLITKLDKNYEELIKLDSDPEADTN